MINTAVILAAGRGSRLDQGGDDPTFSKPLVNVGGMTLLQRSVDACRGAGARRIIVVTGFRSELIQAEVTRLDRGDLQTVHNADWPLANGVSLLACQDVVDDDFALVMADHVFDTTIMNDLMALTLPPETVTLAVDHKLDTIVDFADANKVTLKDGRITHIGKDLAEIHAVDIGVFGCTPAILGALNAVRARTGDCSITDGMREVASAGRFLPMDIGPRWWLNINTIGTLREAERLIDGMSDGP